MSETTPTAEKLVPLALSKQVVTCTKGPTQKMPEETAMIPNTDNSPSSKKKRPSEASFLDSANSFKATAAGGSRDVSVLVAKFAEVLSERASADASLMKELEGILTEARNLESFLKEKKSRLRQTLALISDQLQE